MRELGIQPKRAVIVRNRLTLFAEIVQCLGEMKANDRVVAMLK